MDSELLKKLIGYFPDYLSALSRTLLRFFGQPLLLTAVRFQRQIASITFRTWYVFCRTLLGTVPLFATYVLCISGW